MVYDAPNAQRTTRFAYIVIARESKTKSNATDTSSLYHGKDVDLHRLVDKSADRIQQLEAEKATLVEALTDVILKSEVSLEERQKFMELLSWVSSPPSIPVNLI